MKNRVYLSHETAFQLWRRLRIPGKRLAAASSAEYRPSRPTGKMRNQLADFLLNSGLRPPFDVVVSSSGDRWTADPLFHCRVMSEAPCRDSFFRVLEVGTESLPFELYLPSPELNFVQMACSLTIVQTIGYGFELCGAYTPEESGKDEPVMLSKLTSAKKLESRCNCMSGLDGLRLARHAARHVLDDSRSIRETQLAMALVLPRRLGGLGVMRPQMNYRVQAGNNRESFVSQEYFDIDLCWPQYRVGMEVQSSKHHSGQLKLVKDARRKNSLQFCGYTIIEATQGDLSSAIGVSGLAKQAYAAMGVRPAKGQLDLCLRFIDLHKEVFALSDYP